LLARENQDIAGNGAPYPGLPLLAAKNAKGAKKNKAGITAETKKPVFIPAFLFNI